MHWLNRLWAGEEARAHSRQSAYYILAYMAAWWQLPQLGFIRIIYGSLIEVSGWAKGKQCTRTYIHELGLAFEILFGLRSLRRFS